MKKSLVTLAVLLTAAALIVVFCGPAAAKVTGVCSGCHTMHNSQGGDPMATGGPLATLLTNDCVGCHSSSVSSTTYALGTSTVPVVNFTGGAPLTYLAGGNFWWVAQGGKTNDPKGHNVFGIADQDENITVDEGAPGGFITCGPTGCHATLALKTSLGEPGGCQGCHVRPAHHADDSATVIGAESSSTDGYYRFLSGAHNPDYGVCGIEDSDWQASSGDNDHNEYLGNATGLNNRAIGFLTLGNTMTAFCCGCHGDFHQQNTAADGSGGWIRHPSDAVIPNTGEYAEAFGATGGLGGIYDPNVPVARDIGHGVWTSGTPSHTVDPANGYDMVMCLSCHRPHGSPHDGLLRWDYDNDMIAGGGSNTTGCFACHTKKDTVNPSPIN